MSLNLSPDKFILKIEIIDRRRKLNLIQTVRSASAWAAPSNKVVSKDRSHEDWDTNRVKQDALSFN